MTTYVTCDRLCFFNTRELSVMPNNDITYQNLLLITVFTFLSFCPFISLQLGVNVII
jgi:hypothetical protein